MSKYLILLTAFTIACTDDTPASNNTTQNSADASSDVKKNNNKDAATKDDVRKTDVKVAADVGKDASSKDVDTQDTKTPPVEILRFVVIGDQGTGSQNQYDVGIAMGNVCTALGGCDFGLLLGDNFYSSGVSSVTDDMFNTHFALPYAPVDFPFYAVLGNHDLGGDGLGIDLDRDKAKYQIDYSQTNPKWQMPAEYYSFNAGPVFFAALDTTDIFFRGDDAQERDIPAWAAASNAPWKIAFGHHPFISNGKHGNAGEYDGVKFIPIANGEYIEDFVKDRICGKYDFYLAGHDHSRQDLVAKCGTEFIVSGAGAKTTEIKGDNPNHFQSDEVGFLLMEATTNTMKIQFYDKSGNLDHTRMVTR